MLPKVPGQIWNMFPGGGLAFVATSQGGAGDAVGIMPVVMTGSPMAGPERSVFHSSVPHSLRGRFSGSLIGLALLVGFAIVLGSIAAGHSQPAPEPAAAPAASAAPPADQVSPNSAPPQAA